MTAFLVYIGKVAVLLAVFYLFYRLLMERETFHRQNRAVLLLSVLTSFVLPLCVITTHQVVSIPLPEVSGQQAETTAMPVASPSYWPAVLLIIYVIGLSAKLLYTIYSTIRLHRFISRLELHPQADGTMIAVSNQDIAPFSWWNTIVLSRRDYETNDPALIAHEQAHIQGYHSVDILLMEMLLAVQWFNPAAWLMSRDLRTIHEYEADAAVLARGIDAHHYLSLLMERANTMNHYALTNGISQKILKSRFLMMARKHSSPSRQLKVVYVLPVIGCALMLNARTVVETRFIPSVSTVKVTAADSRRPSIAEKQGHVNDKEEIIIKDMNNPNKQEVRNQEDGMHASVQEQVSVPPIPAEADNDIAQVQSPLEEPQMEAGEAPASVRISGTVVDHLGEPVIGAVIKIRGQKRGMVSDINGEFSISVPQGSTVDVMYIGVGTESLVCHQDQSNLMVTLTQDDSD
jgi:hypothetical protein